MATLRTYSAPFEQLAGAQVMRLRFDETGGGTAFDSVGDLDGTYRNGVGLGAAGVIGDGAARFDGANDFVVVEPLRGSVRVAVLGDSLADPDTTFQSPGNDYIAKLEAALRARGLDATVLDHAVGGVRTANVIDPGREPNVADVIADNPDVVIVELGTNDNGNQVPLDQFESNLRTIVTELRDAGIEVLLTGAFGNSYPTEAARDAFEQVYPNLAAELGVTLLDMDDPTLNNARTFQFLGGTREGTTFVGGVRGDPALQAVDPDTGQPDGLHPNDDGVEFVTLLTTPQTIALGAAASAVRNPLLLTAGAIEVWLVADSVSGRPTFLSKNSNGFGNGGEFAMGIRDGELFFAISDLEHIPTVQGGRIVAGAPTHVVVDFGPGGLRLFVDGVEVASRLDVTFGPDLGILGKGNFEPLVIGAENGPNRTGTPIDQAGDVERFFDGVIDEVAVYDRALTGAEVRALFEAGSERGTTVVGTGADDVLIGGADDETLSGLGGNDLIRGGGGDDILRGGPGRDTLRGGPGNDELLGGRGADFLFGGAGDDVLIGGAGDDVLIGGRGFDSLFGGGGSDTFRITDITHGVDQVFDFLVGTGGDVLDIAAVLQGFVPGTSAPGDFVQLTPTNGNTKVAVVPDGAGADAVTVVNLRGLADLDLAQLVDDGNLQLA